MNRFIILKILFSLFLCIKITFYIFTEYYLFILNHACGCTITILMCSNFWTILFSVLLCCQQNRSNSAIFELFHFILHYFCVGKWMLNFYCSYWVKEHYLIQEASFAISEFLRGRMFLRACTEHEQLNINWNNNSN